jgi:hypothetical protein
MKQSARKTSTVWIYVHDNYGVIWVKIKIGHEILGINKNGCTTQLIFFRVEFIEKKAA